MLFGSGPTLGVSSSDEFTFAIVVNPVGNYYKGAISGIKAFVHTEYDRAAPLGIGRSKAGGNYVADLKPMSEIRAKGYQTGLYLDAKQKK